MKSLVKLINESLNHNKFETIKMLKLIKQGKLKPKNKKLHDKIINILKKKNILEDYDILEGYDHYGEGFYNNYENWVEMALDTWHRNWDTEDDMNKDLNNAQEYFDKEFNKFCNIYGYSKDHKYDRDRLTKIVDTSCDIYRTDFEEGGEDPWANMDRDDE